jgi:hypothetical protein
MYCPPISVSSVSSVDGAHAQPISRHSAQKVEIHLFSVKKGFTPRLTFSLTLSVRSFSSWPLDILEFQRSDAFCLGTSPFGMEEIG